MTLYEDRNRRVLVIDDNKMIHMDFRKILAPKEKVDNDLSLSEQSLFDDVPGEEEDDRFEIDSAFQGAEGLAKIVDARANERPYAVAFVDIRMPPGWDGIETIERILPADPQLQIVICTAHSDYSPQDILARLGRTDRVLILKKPFDFAEILLMTTALVEKWHSSQIAATLTDMLAVRAFD